jgi:hypothetical protein
LKPFSEAVHGVSWPAGSTARTRHQNWSLFNVVGGEYRVLLMPDTSSAMLLKSASSATCRSYVVAPGTGVQSRATSSRLWFTSSTG